MGAIEIQTLVHYSSYNFQTNLSRKDFTDPSPIPCLLCTPRGSIWVELHIFFLDGGLNIVGSGGGGGGPRGEEGAAKNDDILFGS